MHAHRFFGRDLPVALLSALAIAAPPRTSAALVAASVQPSSTEVRVGPAKGSALKWDSPEVAAVRDVLTSVILSQPSCLAGKIGDKLDLTYPGSVGEQDLPVDYYFVQIDGHWVHHCSTETLFVVDLGQRRTVRVEVILTELKN